MKQNNCINHSYALNVQLVMAMQEIDGRDTEVNIPCSFLNSPHGHTIKDTTFHKTGDKLGCII